jgi:hypothetical protein
MHYYAIFPHLYVKYRKHIPAESYWITNISRHLIDLPDLNIFVPPMCHINLLDKKHYRHLTKDQILASVTSGSIASKKGAIIPRKVPPGTPIKAYIDIEENPNMPSRQRSVIPIENITYEELNISDDEYAAENAETAEEDHLGRFQKI